MYEVKSKKAVKLFKICCNSCKAQMGLYIDCEKGEKEAIAEWNARVSDLPKLDYGVANYYWQILHDINPKLAEDASKMARKQVEGDVGVARIIDRPQITAYDLPIGTKATYEKMLDERQGTIRDLKSSTTRYKNLYMKEKNRIGKKKMAITETDFTKIKNAKKYIDALYEIFDGRFEEEYGDDDEVN